MRSMVAAAGGAPAVTTRTPFRARDRALAEAPATPMSTVGAAQNMDPDSVSMTSSSLAGSIFRRQTCAAPTAVTAQTKVHPFAWNIGSVHRERADIRIGRRRHEPQAA